MLLIAALFLLNAAPAAAVAVLDIRGMDETVHQQALRAERDMTLLSPDLPARITAALIDRAPSSSALFTLCESMMQAVGLAS